MQHPLPDLGEWPPLECEQWKDTAETLHMYMQIVGKTRLALTPIQNHWWNIPLYLTACGLTTSAMPADRGILLDTEFDFVSHELVCRTSDGEIRKIALRPVSVAQFFEEFTETLSSLGVSVKIHPMPVEVANPIRCDVDTFIAATTAMPLLASGKCSESRIRFSNASPRISTAKSARCISSGGRSILRSPDLMASERRRRLGLIWSRRKRTHMK
jgi:hypothetical protein